MHIAASRAPDYVVLTNYYIQYVHNCAIFSRSREITFKLKTIPGYNGIVEYLY